MKGSNRGQHLGWRPEAYGRGVMAPRAAAIEEKVLLVGSKADLSATGHLHAVGFH